MSSFRQANNVFLKIINAKMGTKEIIIIAAVAAIVAVRLYQRYSKGKIPAPGGDKKTVVRKGSLESQPDDYKPYSGR